MLLSNKTDCQKLFELLKTLSFQKGEFILASGKTSNFYMDCRMTTLSGQGSYLIGKLLYERIATLHVDAVGGMSMGADPIVSSVIYRAAEMGQSLNGFLIRKEPKGHGRTRQVEGHLDSWMRVVLLEDVVTTAGSTVKAIEAVRAVSPEIEIVKVLSLVDRGEGGGDRINQLGIQYEALFEIDAFLRD
ncbi:MAG: orotate phosphoribosyltransferase [Vampirovibrionales bacterium]|nr:orotate phosphoribosyltransferase [Vampirovibrionales bacterium]